MHEVEHGSEFPGSGRIHEALWETLTKGLAVSPSIQWMSMDLLHCHRCRAILSKVAVAAFSELTNKKKKKPTSAVSKPFTKMSLSSPPSFSSCIKPKSLLATPAALLEMLWHVPYMDACHRAHCSSFPCLPDLSSRWCPAFLSCSCPYRPRHFFFSLIKPVTTQETMRTEELGGIHESAGAKPGRFGLKNVLLLKEFS